MSAKHLATKIAGMVDAVTKLSKREGIRKDFAEKQIRDERVSDQSSLIYRTEREAESLRKMILGLVKDVRVVLIKLADRLHNMRTLQALLPEKQRRIARETLEIFAPLANRLGIWEWKLELEDLGFRYAEPDTYFYLSSLVEAGAQERDMAVQNCIAQLRNALIEHGISEIAITGRAKPIYSTWRKMQRKSVSFQEIYDIRAMRVIIEDSDSIEVINTESDDLRPRQTEIMPNALDQNSNVEEDLSTESIVSELTLN